MSLPNIYLVNTYKEGLAINNQQVMICPKTQTIKNFEKVFAVQ